MAVMICWPLCVDLVLKVSRRCVRDQLLIAIFRFWRNSRGHGEKFECRWLSGILVLLFH